MFRAHLHPAEGTSPSPNHRRTGRASLLTAAGLAGTLLLAACGSDSTGGHTDGIHDDMGTPAATASPNTPQRTPERTATPDQKTAETVKSIDAAIAALPDALLSDKYQAEHPELEVTAVDGDGDQVPRSVMVTTRDKSDIKPGHQGAEYSVFFAVDSATGKKQITQANLAVFGPHDPAAGTDEDSYLGQTQLFFSGGKLVKVHDTIGGGDTTIGNPGSSSDLFAIANQVATDLDAIGIKSGIIQRTSAGDPLPTTTTA